MKVFILSVLVACASAQYYPGYYGYNLSPFAYSGLTGYPAYSTYAAYPAYSSSQYHAQDELGQATYGYSYPGQASSTTRDAFGNQIGSYAYINAEGKEVRVSYVADANGFRVLSNDLPQAPVDNQVAPVFTGVGPAPVEDTPEVVAAKAEFFKLYKEAADAAAAAPESRKKRSVLAYSYPIAAALPAYAKTTVKTAYFEKDEAAMTPAATTKIDLKEKEHEVLTPLAYHAPLTVQAPLAVRTAVVAPAPITTKVLTTPYFGYGYHVVA